MSLSRLPNVTSPLTRAKANALLGAIRRPGNIGMRLGPCGFMSDFALDAVGTGSSAGTTWDVKIALATQFDAIRLVFAQSNTNGGIANFAASTAAGSTVQVKAFAVSDLTAGAAAGTAGYPTFGGAAVGALTIPNETQFAATRRKSFLISDILPISSVPRSDGGSGSILNARLWVQGPGTNGAGTISCMGAAGAQAGVYGNLNAVWNARPDGRVWQCRKQSGDKREVGLGGGAAGGLTTQCPLIGVIFYSRQQVVNVVGLGDSIYEGLATIGQGFIHPACVNLSTSALAVEFSNLAWQGATAAEIMAMLKDAMGAPFPIDLLAFPSFTWNGTGGASSPITAAQIDACRQMSAIGQGMARSAGIPVITTTGVPINVSIKNVGSSDILRRAYNDEIRVRGTAGTLYVADADIVVSDGVTSGQAQFPAAMTFDQAHPSDAGNALIAAKEQAALSALLPAVTGGLY